MENFKMLVVFEDILWNLGFFLPFKNE